MIQLPLPIQHNITKPVPSPPLLARYMCTIPYVNIIFTLATLC